MSEQISLKTGGLNVSTHLEESPFRLDEYEEVSWTSLAAAEITDTHTCSGNSTVLVLSRSQHRCNVRSLGRRSAPFHVSHTTFAPIRCHRTDSFPTDSEQLNQFDRLKTLIKGQASSYANSVHESGHTFAVMHSASQYGSVDQMSENLFGITQVNRMQEIARLENFDEIVKQLIEIGNHVLNKSSLRFVSRRHRLQSFIERIGFQLCTERRSNWIDPWNETIGNLSRSIARSSDQSTATDTPWRCASNPEERFSTRKKIVPSENAFRNALRCFLFWPMLPECSLCSRRSCSVRLLAPRSDTLDVRSLDCRFSANWCSTSFCCVKFEKSVELTVVVLTFVGIYSVSFPTGRCRSMRQNWSTLFSFSSDPHSVETLKRFDQCVDYFHQGKFTEKDVDEAKLATFQKVSAFDALTFELSLCSWTSRNHLVIKEWHAFSMALTMRCDKWIAIASSPVENKTWSIWRRNIWLANHRQRLFSGPIIPIWSPMVNSVKWRMFKCLPLANDISDWSDQFVCVEDNKSPLVRVKNNRRSVSSSMHVVDEHRSRNRTQWNSDQVLAWWFAYRIDRFDAVLHIARVSSVLNKDNKNYGKKNLIDGSEETCWNSEAVRSTAEWLSSLVSVLIDVSRAHPNGSRSLRRKLFPWIVLLSNFREASPLVDWSSKLDSRMETTRPSPNSIRMIMANFKYPFFPLENHVSETLSGSSSLTSLTFFLRLSSSSGLSERHVAISIGILR